MSQNLQHANDEGIASDTGVEYVAVLLLAEARGRGNCLFLKFYNKDF